MSVVAQTSNEGGARSSTFVLVHGTFQWGGQWVPLASILEEQGYTVHMPTLSGLGERNNLLSKQVGLSTHIEDVKNYIQWYNVTNVILVGHSYGGAVITGVADALPDRIAHVVYVDATVLNQGENLVDDFFTTEVSKGIKGAVDKFGDGWLIPPEFLRNPPPKTMSKQPFKTYTDRIDLQGPPPKSGTVINATENPEIFGVIREKGSKRAKERGWSLHIVEGPHPLQEKNPSKQKVAEILLDIAQDNK
ncbi:hypothetical protein Mag101_01890 [Microbulbifer agarilyticus]|uniref:AB hydrolase-1 domain-containing protein n=2 Tax=Microbulbifer agarilyticus TaxID=260552 RepID=A0A1Q2M9B2_9GAMM|nr:hypothetical protein Mag101_01890 [Microbulbifer agarilyticus]